MSSESNTELSVSGRHAFWLSHAALEKRLSFLLPAYRADGFSITTTDLASNASFVNYVRHHRLTELGTGETLDVVEKSIRKIGFITSLESRFYRERDVLADSVHFKHPTCLGVIETPWESLIFTDYVQGRAPRMAAIAVNVARGIAEIETLSSRHVQWTSRWQARRFWTMDFFRPWYLLRSRFNYQRFLPALENLAKLDERFSGLTDQMHALSPMLRRAATTARNSQRCFCHMDYLRKNLFLSPEGLQLIDWSEVKVGRIGFDGGAYLSAIFRRNDLPGFIKVRDEFLQAYAEALDERFDRQSAMLNLNYIFLLNSLWHCLRPETIAEYREKEKMTSLREKYDYLLALPLPA
ncbi:phosphotransferase family protein [Pseudomonas sp. PGPR40]|uniref:phosphotransferase family protein n=1 Tax=Pseudomonas sp. PGPR40 TaxID=2913476 RepID=UPI001EDBC90F|nr:phosphotransferase [Pseudomonas sp. PGPR40]